MHLTSPKAMFGRLENRKQNNFIAIGARSLHVHVCMVGREVQSSAEPHVDTRKPSASDVHIYVTCSWMTKASQPSMATYTQSIRNSVELTSLRCCSLVFAPLPTQIN